MYVCMTVSYYYAAGVYCYIEIPTLLRLYEHFKKQFIRDFDNFYLISFKVTILLCIHAWYTVYNYNIVCMVLYPAALLCRTIYYWMPHSTISHSHHSSLL